MSWQLVVFDNDGVLVDSERLANQALAHLLTELGHPTTYEESVAAYLGGTIERVRALVEGRTGRPLPADFEDRYFSAIFTAFDDGLAAVPGVTAVLDGLDEADIRYCVASSGSHERIHRTLRQVGLWPRFDGRAFSAADVPHGKPAPDLFRHAAQVLGADPAATVVIEDSPLGIEAARAAGMAVIGYGAVTPPERLTGAGAIVTSMEEVRTLVVAGPPLAIKAGP